LPNSQVAIVGGGSRILPRALHPQSIKPSGKTTTIETRRPRAICLVADRTRFPLPASRFPP
jgi:hypothetical protein